MEQTKLIVLGMAWYMFQGFTFMVLANYLVYVTFHEVAPSNPSYPGRIAEGGVSGKFEHHRLFDIGFQHTPDLSWRPWYLKTTFVDANVFLAQMLPPMLLILSGQTKRFVTYVGAIGTINILKGIIQVITLLPPANDGQQCWHKNFSEQEIAVVVGDSIAWIFTKSWGMTHGCNDMLWSGHTSQSVVGFLFISSALKREGCSIYFINTILFLYFCGYIWSVLACRMHYSVDVLIAAITGYFVYTHAGFRQFCWCSANKVAGNPPGSGSTYESLKDPAA